MEELNYTSRSIMTSHIAYRLQRTILQQTQKGMFDRPDNQDLLHFHLLFLVLLLLLVVSTFRNKKRKVCSRTLWQFILGLLRAALLSEPRYIKTFSIIRLDLICCVVKITALLTKNLRCLQNAVSLLHNTSIGHVLTVLKPVNNSGNSAYRLLSALDALS